MIEYIYCKKLFAKLNKICKVSQKIQQNLENRCILQMFQ